MKVANHKGSEADMDEPLSNPESKYTEHTEKEEVAELDPSTLLRECKPVRYSLPFRVFRGPRL